MKTKEQNDLSNLYFNKMTEAEENKMISELTDSFLETYDPEIRELKDSLLTYFESKTKSIDEHQNGILSGIRLFDVYLGGFKPGEVTLIGSSSLYFTAVFPILSSLMDDKDLNIGVISSRNSESEFITRLLGAYTHTECKKLRHFIFQKDDFDKIRKSCERVYSKPIFITTEEYPTIEEFKTACFKLKYEKNLDIMFVDGLESVGKETDCMFGSLFEKNRAISRFLKEISVCLEIPIVAFMYSKSSSSESTLSESFASSGISFSYLDNICYFDLDKSTDCEGKNHGLFSVIKSGSGSIQESVTVDMKTGIII